MLYLVSCNLSEILVVTATGLLGHGAGLLPLQILFLNLLTDVFLALEVGGGFMVLAYYQPFMHQSLDLSAILRTGFFLQLAPAGVVLGLGQLLGRWMGRRGVVVRSVMAPVGQPGE